MSTIESVLDIDRKIDALSCNRRELQKLNRKRRKAVRRMHSMDPRYKVYGVPRVGNLSGSYKFEYEIEKVIVRMKKILTEIEGESKNG